jgi:hypothetical protein
MSEACAMASAPRPARICSGGSTAAVESVSHCGDDRVDGFTRSN